jgi:ParB family transcriptional regulator, chromosome partitioning protein
VLTLVDDYKSPRLGRGLAALIGNVTEEPNILGQAKRVPIEFLRPNARNPRKDFREEDLDDLTNSIREKGIIQPILARPLSYLRGVYEIIAGERRWRAAQRAGLHEVPVLLLDIGDKEALEIAIIENVQRADLNAVEEALGYQQLMAEFSYSQQDLGRIIGKSRSHVANTLRLTKLPQSVQNMVIEGRISAGHARALLSVSDPERIAGEVLSQGLTVRDVERIVQRESQFEQDPPKIAPKSAKIKDSDTISLEKALTNVLGLQVTIDHRGEKGEIRIRYKTLEQLDHICQRLKD